MNKLKLKNITNYIGIVAVFVAGLLYVLLADILLTIQSVWLMLAIVLSFGSAACFLISDNFREKQKTMYTLKGVAIGVAVLFIGYCLMYLLIALSPSKDLSNASSFAQSFAIKRVEDSYTPKKDAAYNTIVTVASIVITAIGIAAQIFNTVLTVQLKDED